jgi:dihydrofolate reductase
MSQNNPRISAIAAINKIDRAIGINNTLLWKIPEDLRRFKELASGHPIIMGRKTFESIGRALPNRTNIVITRNPDFIAEGCIICSSTKDAIDTAKKYDNQEIFIIGGGQIYSEALPVTDRIYLTLVESDALGDVFFPQYADDFKIVSDQQNHPDHNPKFEWITLDR